MARRTEFGKERDRRPVGVRGVRAPSASSGRLGLPVPYPVQLDDTEMLMEFIGTERARPRRGWPRPGPTRDLLPDLFEQLRDGDARLGAARLGPRRPVAVQRAARTASGSSSSTGRRSSTSSATRTGSSSSSATATPCAPGSSPGASRSTRASCSATSWLRRRPAGDPRPGRREGASADEDAGPHPHPAGAPEEVHRRQADPAAAVRLRRRGHHRVAVDGDAAVEVLRPVACPRGPSSQPSTRRKTRKSPDGVTATWSLPPWRYVRPDPVLVLKTHRTTPALTRTRVWVTLVDLDDAALGRLRRRSHAGIDPGPGRGPADAVTGQPGDLLHRDHRLPGQVTEPAVGSAQPVAQRGQPAAAGRARRRRATPSAPSGARRRRRFRRRGPGAATLPPPPPPYP